MFLKLTNNIDGLKGDPIYINMDHVKSIYERQIPEGGFVTELFSDTNLVWFVEESPALIYKMLQGATLI